MILSLVHTQLLLTCQSQYIVIVMQISTGGTGSQPLCNCVPTSQHNIDTHVNDLLSFQLGDNIGIVSWTQGMS